MPTRILRKFRKKRLDDPTPPPPPFYSMDSASRFRRSRTRKRYVLQILILSIRQFTLRTLTEHRKPMLQDGNEGMSTIHNHGFQCMGSCFPIPIQKGFRRKIPFDVLSSMRMKDRAGGAAKEKRSLCSDSPEATHTYKSFKKIAINSKLYNLSPRLSLFETNTKAIAHLQILIHISKNNY